MMDPVKEDHTMTIQEAEIATYESAELSADTVFTSCISCY